MPKRSSSSLSSNSEDGHRGDPLATQRMDGAVDTVDGDDSSSVSSTDSYFSDEEELQDFNEWQEETYDGQVLKKGGSERGEFLARALEYFSMKMRESSTVPTCIKNGAKMIRVSEQKQDDAVAEALGTSLRRAYPSREGQAFDSDSEDDSDDSQVSDEEILFKTPNNDPPRCPAPWMQQTAVAKACPGAPKRPPKPNITKLSSGGENYEKLKLSRSQTTFFNN